MKHFRAIAHRKAGRGQLLPVGERVSIKGIECEVVDDAKADTADMVVCVEATQPLIFADNMTGPCADCGMVLQWRPHSPKRPPKVCMECAMERVEAS
jgi:hypothetical protein